MEKKNKFEKSIVIVALNKTTLDGHESCSSDSSDDEIVDLIEPHGEASVPKVFKKKKKKIKYWIKSIFKNEKNNREDHHSVYHATTQQQQQ